MDATSKSDAWSLRDLKMKVFDAVVIGTGGIGSAAIYHLAKHGLRVAGIDQFTVAHDQGSSHGQSRIIRQAYFEHPDYVPLLRRAYQLWHELETETETNLFDQIGLVEFGPPHETLIQGIQASARQHNLAIETLSARESQERFPLFRVPEEMVAIFEPTAGVLHVESCVKSHIRAAVAHHAELHLNCRVNRIDLESNPIVLATNSERFQTERLIVCGGAWTSKLLPIPVKLKVARKHIHWFHTDDRRWEASQPCPAFFYQRPQGYFYGFPAFDQFGVKVAEHSGADAIDDPAAVDRSPDPVDEQRVHEFISTQLVNVNLERTRHEVCLYTLSEDEHFIVDSHPSNPRVAFAAGMSGHGFKFASVLGEILANLVLHGGSPHPIDFLSLARFR